MADFGFVGAAYEAPNPYADAQKCVNWYPEIDQSKGAKGDGYGSKANPSVIGLLGCPGLLRTTFLGGSTSLTNGEVRGLYVLPGGNSLLAAADNFFFVLTVTVPGTATTPPQFSTLLVGNLANTTGPVQMQDNGAGGQVFIDDGVQGYVFTIATNAFAVVADPNYLGTSRIAFIDGFLLFNQPGTQKIYCSPNYSTGPFNGAFFEINDSTPDNVVTHAALKRAWWVLNEKSTQVWYNAGGAFFPFQRIDGAMLQIGCQAAQSLAPFNEGLMWLAKSERGQNVVVQTSGYSYEVISTRAVDHAIASYNVVSDAIAYTYQEEGHEFYVITFPTQDVTWVYDGTSGLWHQRLSFDTLTGFHRHRSNCYANFQNQRLVGDYANGRLYRMSRQYYDDDGQPLVCWRRTPHIWDGDHRSRVFHSRLQIEFAPGVGLSTGQGSNPECILKWSDDGGANYGNEHLASVGRIGETKNRAIWRRLGYARDRIYDARYSEPTVRDVVGATLDAGAEDG